MFKVFSRWFYCFFGVGSMVDFGGGCMFLVIYVFRLIFLKYLFSYFVFSLKCVTLKKIINFINLYIFYCFVVFRKGCLFDGNIFLI